MELIGELNGGEQPCACMRMLRVRMRAHDARVHAAQSRVRMQRSCACACACSTVRKWSAIGTDGAGSDEPSFASETAAPPRCAVQRAENSEAESVARAKERPTRNHMQQPRTAQSAPTEKPSIVSTRILGRRTAPIAPFLIPHPRPTWFCG